MNLINNLPDNIVHRILLFCRSREADIIHKHVDFIKSQILSSDMWQGSKKVDDIMKLRLALQSNYNHTALLLVKVPYLNEHQLLLNYLNDPYYFRISTKPSIKPFVKNKKKYRNGEKRYFKYGR